MMASRVSRLLGASLGMVLLATVGVSAVEPDLEVAAAERVLKDAKIAADGPTLLAFFRERTPSDAQRLKLNATVRLLGDDAFRVREQASADLLAAGRAALPFLHAALRDPDPEVVCRADRCLKTLGYTTDLSLTTAAARVLAVRRPAGATEALLAYLPMATEDVVEEAVLSALVVVGLRDGKVEAVLTAALNDKEPARRAGAALVVSKAGPEQRKLVSRLLTDPEAKVRFHASAALVRAGDKSGVPPLMALLNEGPPELAWQAEDFLFRLAGAQAPAATLGSADQASRRKSLEAWQTWWQANEAKVDLTKLTHEDPLTGATVIAELDGGGKTGNGRVWECGPDGKLRWQIEDVVGPIGVQLLPGGRVLIAEHGGQRVTERDREGKIVWRTAVTNNPISCQRLANGNTFIATYNQLMEVDRDGKTLYSHRGKGTIFCALKLRSGNILYVHSGGLVEMESGGKEVRSLNVPNLSGWASVEPLPNGHYLIAQYNSSKVVEIDSAGKVHWECNSPTPTYASRLRNGHTLVTNTEGRTVIEYDRSGKEVWKQTTQGRPFLARRY